MAALPTPFRKQLEAAVRQARRVAESGARKALEALAVHEADPYRHLDGAQRALRRRLRAQARQLGDTESHSRPGTYDIEHLSEKLAYDHWHRLLFARFLLENHLLVSQEHEVAVSLADCEELAPGLGLKDAWAVAGHFTARLLPEAFRADDPVAGVALPIEERNQLLRLLTGLPAEVFTASDSLGWTYQFWQAERKDQVNEAGRKIGARELPSVTQLFTEDYMVDFLLDNTLGAWWAGKGLAANPGLAESARSEDELRQAGALPGCPWNHLRFIQGKDGRWTPAAGTFDGWPKTAKELKSLDPCMGSGHFVVAMFERLVALRIAEKQLDEAATAAAVIRDNLFGLEIDPRCTQIAAFNLALAAWRRVGHCQLPAMNLACSGLAPNTREADWLAIAGTDQKLQRGMERLYRLFQKAAVLGSLINPRAGEDDLLVATFHELQPLLEKALAQETQDDTAHEMAVTARGLAKAAEILAGQFTLVATNVPYLGRSKQPARNNPNDPEELSDYCERVHPKAKADLATCFVERCLNFCAESSSTALVTPQSWLFQNAYSMLRKRLLHETEWNLIGRLGTRAFETISGEVVNVVMPVITRRRGANDHAVSGFDASGSQSPSDKAEALRLVEVALLSQLDQLSNPDSTITFSRSGLRTYLRDCAGCYQGLTTADDGRWKRHFWEVAYVDRQWRFLQTPSQDCGLFSGRGDIVFHILVDTDDHTGVIRGHEAWGKRGIAIDRVGSLARAVYDGDLFHSLVPVVVPHDPKHFNAIAAFCLSSEFVDLARAANQGLSIDNGYLSKLPFDLAHWQKVAAEEYPHGLPKPFSSDPTQWLFNGHPKGSDQPLHVAVARLLGYRWPRQTGSSFPDCPALGPDGLETLADDDGIVCLSATKGEQPAAERLRTLLATALDSFDLTQLLATAGPKGSKSETLDEWLRDEFFEQHCAIFHHRPFIWHIWDGLKNGFSALVNYHRLNHANLEKLTFAYLGDWIRRQQAAVEAGEAGSDARLQAARELQSVLKLILEGEPPYDIFVRWKPLSRQAIGWNPDLNDGVRMNIRPFLLAPDVGRKGAGILRAKPNIKWDKDRGREPQRDKAEYPWFWAGGTFTGARINDIHLTRAQKTSVRDS